MYTFRFQVAAGSKSSRGWVKSISSSWTQIRSASALPVSREKMRYTFLKWGVVILAGFSLILILGRMCPWSSSMADSLYTPPKTGSEREVMSRSPTPKESMRAPWRIRSRMMYSSRALEATILQPVRPASSSISRAFRDR